MKTVAILGGSGFVGEYIIDELLESKYSVKIIKRKQSVSYPRGGCQEVVVDLYSDFLHKQLSDCDCVIYNIGIIREFPNKGISFKDLHQDLAIHVINMAQKAGVRKFILMTANGVDRCLTDYEKTKFKSERHLMKSKLQWTIFRPSVIFGDPKGKIEFCTQVKRDMVKIPFPLPMFFSGVNIFKAGLFRMSPIHVKNVSQFCVGAIDKKESNQRIYELGGTISYSWAEMIRTISNASGKRKWSIPIPIRVVKFLAYIFDRFSWFPVTQDQLTMLIQGNVCDSYKYYADFNIDEINFNITSLKYLS
jgi:NADH dehydrogenase